MAAIDEILTNAATIEGSLSDSSLAQQPLKVQVLQLAALLYVAELLEEVVANTT